LLFRAFSIRGYYLMNYHFKIYYLSLRIKKEFSDAPNENFYFLVNFFYAH
jgi:hypothetical protein